MTRTGSAPSSNTEHLVPGAGVPQSVGTRRLPLRRCKTRRVHQWTPVENLRLEEPRACVPRQITLVCPVHSAAKFAESTHRSARNVPSRRSRARRSGDPSSCRGSADPVRHRGSSESAPPAEPPRPTPGRCLIRASSDRGRRPVRQSVRRQA
uniref:Uncharacterized protein n=1 Tax=Rhodococcus sp. T104 TaxID=230533 RepID=B6VJI4_9NOCA|nr:hypothetical protein [Rhodococcus sp. T104]